MERLKLLIPLDGTDISRQVLEYVPRFFPPDVYTVRLLRVAETPQSLGILHATHAAPSYGSIYNLPSATPQTSPGAGQYKGQEEENLRALLKDDLTQEVEQLETFGYAAHPEVRFGNPVGEIVGFAHDEAIDLVAMASHGRTGLGRLLSGSVAEEVFRRLDIPVFLVRADTSEKSESRAEKSVEVSPETHLESRPNI